MCCIGTILLMATLGVAVLRVANWVRRALGRPVLGRASLDWERPVLTSAGERMTRPAVARVAEPSRRTARVALLAAIACVAALAGGFAVANPRSGGVRVERADPLRLAPGIARTNARRSGLLAAWCSVVHPEDVEGSDRAGPAAQTEPQG